MKIIPIKELRDTTKVSDAAHAKKEPIFVTKNGYPDLVLFSQELYDEYFPWNKMNQVEQKEISVEHCKDFMGWVRVGAASIPMHIGDVSFQKEQILQVMEKADQNKVNIVVFPELCLTGYTCSDLFYQDDVLLQCEVALQEICKKSEKLRGIYFIGCPIRKEEKLYNCAVVISQGKILGVVPKTCIPNYREFYEMRQFSPAPEGNSSICILHQEVPFGNRLLFQCLEEKDIVLAAEICEDLWVPETPSQHHAMAGATIIVNLSASNELVGKKEYRQQLVSSTSARLICGYVYCSAGVDESTTDLVFSGAKFICENGTILQEGERFQDELVSSEIDVQYLMNERRKMNTYPMNQKDGYQVIPFHLHLENITLSRKYSPTPFLPSNPLQRSQRMEEILTLQAWGLRKRFAHTKLKYAILGLSGGLDSTLALLVVIEAFRLLHYPLSQVICVTMPCFATSHRTKNNAYLLAEQLGVTLKEVDISKAVLQHFEDIGHDASKTDVTYENSQARERMQVLMDIANQMGGLVIGTGDLSEIALGWSTYNGDHMSMYGVNGSIPKTLVREIVFQYAKTHANVHDVLMDILDTPVSPELVPGKDREIVQKTEEVIGPYELHDFFLYHFVRKSESVEKILYLATASFEGKYTRETIKKWLEFFLRRFFSQQFKRSCMPDGVKVGSVSLSPRGDWRMPSDASANSLLEELKRVS